MSGIPAWAYRGAKVVVIDTTPGRFGGTAGDKGDICEIIETTMFGDEPACRVKDEKGRGHPFGEWARLSRYRPLITQQDDISTHFAQYLNAPHKPVREGV